MSDRSSVAKEAARLLYIGAVVEYIQAKEMAVENLGANAIPSNYEIAVELDKLADELEGGLRQRRLREMRERAIDIMRVLKKFNPRLIGSVWRGTAKNGSDIDIIALSSSHQNVEASLNNFPIKEKGEVSFKGGVRAYHIKLEVGVDEVEVVVRDPTEYSEETCDIYGDIKRGLKLEELERLLKVDPLRKFIPRRRPR